MLITLSAGPDFVHGETSVRALKDEFDKVAWHNEGHLAQVEAALVEGVIGKIRRAI